MKTILNSDYSISKIARPRSWKIRNTGIGLSNKSKQF